VIGIERIPHDVVAEPKLRAERHLLGWSSRALGDYWLASELSPVLRVSSSVVPAEFNYLLNPLHPEFAGIQVEAPVIFAFDERLFG
jgi:RES domain-containing protein